MSSRPAKTSPVASSTVNPQLASKLTEVRNRAETHGQVFTNLPKPRYADARFDDRPSAVAVPTLRKDGFDVTPGKKALASGTPERGVLNAIKTLGGAVSSALSIHDSDLSDTAEDESQREAELAAARGLVVQPLPYAEEKMSCSRCGVDMKNLSVEDTLRDTVISRSCSTCGEQLLASSAIRSLSLSYPFPAAHECSSCGCILCIRCNIVHNVQLGMRRLQTITENDCRQANAEQVKLLESQLRDAFRQSTAGSVSPTESPAAIALFQSFKDRVSDLDNKLAEERKSKEQTACLLSSLQREYINYKQDVEMHLQSNVHDPQLLTDAAEQILLQSRLVEQSVQLADAKAKIDELSSIQRRSGAEDIFQSENRRLRDELDRVKSSMHSEFDSWKTAVMRQVRTECLKYKERLHLQMMSKLEERTSRIGGGGDNNGGNISDKEDDNDANGSEDVFTNERELDFLFDEADWTGKEEDLLASPQKMREYVAKAASADNSPAPSVSSRASQPEDDDYGLPKTTTNTTMGTTNQ